jgi:hypothetical protein
MASQEPVSLGGNFYLNPLNENTNCLAYQHNFINIKSAEPSLGIPNINTYAVSDTPYYFPIISINTTYIDSRKFSNFNDSLVYWNNKIGIGTNEPNQKLSVMGGISGNTNIIIGDNNYSSSSSSSILGGSNNSVDNENSTIAGGTANSILSACGLYGFIGGGFYNQINSGSGIIAGGTQNIINGNASNINGGGNNIVDGAASNINGGNYNTICTSSDNSVIAGGKDNTISGYCSVIGGGFCNISCGDYTIINGGYCNEANSNFTVINGGYCNIAVGSLGENGNYILGGGCNLIAGSSNVIVGGYGNTSSGYYNRIGGGQYNFVSGCFNYIGNGCCNSSSANYSTIVNGICNIIQGNNHSTILGGYCNTLKGDYSTIIGGTNNVLSANNSFILGSNIQVDGIDNTTFVENLSVLLDITSDLTIKGNVNIEKNLFVYGSISALSGLTNINTDNISTSSLNLENYGIGPALYVFQDGNYPIAEFVSNQLSDVLYIGNTPTNPLDGTTGFVGINTSTPNVELTVNGSISSNGVIYVSGGNSDMWNRSAIMQVTSIGDGVNSSFIYYHNFGSRDVITQIYDNISYNVVYPLVSNTTIDSITISFEFIPPVDQYRVLVKT